jgi:hypothetical protein
MSSTIQSITSAIPSLGRARLLISSADDVVIVSAVRTPVTRVSQHPFTLFLLGSLGHLLVPIRFQGQEQDQIITRIRMALTNRPRRVVSKIVYQKTYSPQYSRRPSLGQRLTQQRLGELYPFSSLSILFRSSFLLSGGE